MPQVGSGTVGRPTSFPNLNHAIAHIRIVSVRQRITKYSADQERGPPGSVYLHLPGMTPFRAYRSPLSVLTRNWVEVHLIDHVKSEWREWILREIGTDRWFQLLLSWTVCVALKTLGWYTLTTSEVLFIPSVDPLTGLGHVYPSTDAAVIEVMLVESTVNQGRVASRCDRGIYL